MAVLEHQSNSPARVVQLTDRHKGESLWMESWRRLRRNKAAVLGGIIILLNLLVSLFAPIIATRPYDKQVLADNNSVPLWVTQVFPNMKPREAGGYVNVNNDYLLGADQLGRDMFSRIVYGTRVSLTVAFIGPLVSIIIGMLVGLTAGYFGGLLDNILMRIVEIMYAFPTLLFIILLMTFFRTSFAHPEPGTLSYSLGQIDLASGGMLFIFIGIGLTSWMQMARLVRGQVLSVREQEYVEAAHAVGANTPRIMFSHILPNILGPLIVAETLTIPTYISYEAFLSFIGLG
ncbi:MAG TPA: ABC transporter permease, partial [Phototrophicaceae bacterium]|nr:ABC transporter permease [Phototrophicaceae bacterium]